MQVLPIRVINQLLQKTWKLVVYSETAEANSFGENKLELEKCRMQPLNSIIDNFIYKAPSLVIRKRGPLSQQPLDNNQ